MKNKTIAIIGIISYIISVLASAENSEGVYVAPLILIILSAVATLSFFILATIRLWKPAKYISIMLIISAVLLFSTSLIQELTLPTYGSSIIILFNITKVFNLFTNILAIIKLFQKENK